jgi:hypothetical protein
VHGEPQLGDICGEFEEFEPHEIQIVGNAADDQMPFQSRRWLRSRGHPGIFLHSFRFQSYFGSR